MFFLENQLQHYKCNQLNISYGMLFDKEDSERLFLQLLDYTSQHFEKPNYFKVLGRPVSLPRFELAFGNPGTQYNYAGNSISAQPWIEPLHEIRRKIFDLTGHT